MRPIIFIAPPAAGKGVQSKLLEEKYHIPHISTGDLLRNEIQNNSGLGQEINEIMRRGDLVNDEIIIKLLENRLNNPDTVNGYILDGYPRTLEQAHAYDQLLNKLNREMPQAILLDIDVSEAMRRIVGRRTCLSCGASHNDEVPMLKPKVPGICNKCGNTLIHRPDDNEESFNHRFAEYLSKTAPILQFYKDKGILSTVKIEEYDEPLSVLGKIEQIINN